MTLNRRALLTGGAVTAAGLATLACSRTPAVAAGGKPFEVTLPDAEWRKRLSPAAYHVLREEGTEIPGSSPLNSEHRRGAFWCGGCALPLFDSKTKFDSGTGWPSFYAPMANAVQSDRDTSLGMVRDEVHCRRCGGHLGHVFNDGPRPTGLRYCMNGVAMSFHAA